MAQKGIKQGTFSNKSIYYATYATLNRPRPKGRDIFDIVFLLGKTKPKYDYLKLKVDIDSSQDLKAAIVDRCSKIDMAEMAKDVAPFLFDAKGEKRVRLFMEYLRQVEL